MEKLEPSYSLGRNIKCRLKNGVAGPPNGKREIATSQLFAPRYIPERNEHVCSLESTHANVHGSIIHNRQKAEATKYL